MCKTQGASLSCSSGERCGQDGLKGKTLRLSASPKDVRPPGWMTDQFQQMWREEGRRELHLQERSAAATTECLPPGPDGGSVLLLLTHRAAAVKEVLSPQLLLPLGDGHPTVVRPCGETTLGRC